MIKTKTWVLIILIIFALSLTVTLLLWLRPASGQIANIYVDGELVRSVDLASLTSEVTFTVETPGGVNTVCAAPGRIRVTDADCPDKVCVRSGWLTSSAPIVCLPHRLVIKLEDSGGLDAVSR